MHRVDERAKGGRSNVGWLLHVQAHRWVHTLRSKSDSEANPRELSIYVETHDKSRSRLRVVNGRPMEKQEVFFTVYAK